MHFEVEQVGPFLFYDHRRKKTLPDGFQVMAVAHF
jgi:hypothetical protein